ncbi:AAC(3) family N-acetyltransferase [Paenibacillus cisolokensis]|uniref:aminoglycoside N(3)-acetyltransferase n=1 Tax=Paenibacillus cisolokensis TaxID=1658519 RepID=UPI003D290D7C
MIIERPITMNDMVRDLKVLGVTEGMTLLVHSSLKSIGGWIPGGPEAAILALEEAIGREGTLVMPTQSSNLTDPATWRNPPAAEAWWQLIRDEMPPYDPDLTVTTGMGVIAETFRKQAGVVRSSHPQLSFAARGPLAKQLMCPHELDFGLGDPSPLARLYETGAYVLHLGTGHATNTSFHLAEYRADWEGKKVITSCAPIRRAGERTEWVTFEDINFYSDDFEQLGMAFEAAYPDAWSRGQIGNAPSLLAVQPTMVDYAVNWLKAHRKAERPKP